MTREPGEIVDCHVHIVDQVRFPYAPEGGYRPGHDEQGTAADLAKVMQDHGVTSALLVQPSCYGADVSAMADAVAGNPSRFTFVSGLPLPPEQPGHLGARLNLVNLPVPPDGPGLVQSLSDCARRGLWVEVQCPAPRLPDYLPALRRSGARLLFDHLGYPDVKEGTEEPGFQALCDLGGSDGIAVKLSGAFRLARTPKTTRDVDPFAARILEAFGPEACVWGSDWPFVGMADKPGYQSTLDTLTRWCHDPAARSAILSGTPKKLFGLGA